jgi:hypothetical protein
MVGIEPTQPACLEQGYAALTARPEGIRNSTSFAVLDVIIALSENDQKMRENTASV